MKKFALPIVLLALLISLQAAKYGAKYAGLDVPLTIDMAVVVYESLNQPVAEASVMNGETARAWKKANRWRQYDKDKLPEQLKPVLHTVIEKHKVPCLFLFNAGKLVDFGPFPKTDAELKTKLEGVSDVHD